MTAGVGRAATVRVVLQGLPVALARQSAEHHADLIREFALIALDGGADGVPARLLALVDEVQTQYADAVAAVDRDREAAWARGEPTTDMVVTLPASVGPAAARLLELLEEADEFCRRGKHLLTLATSPEVAAYRRWYLGQFTAQAAGAEPTPWHPPAAG